MDRIGKDKQAMELWQKYQLPKSSRTKEGIEWSMNYAYNAPDDSSPRVFLIGDSICYGYQDAVRKNLEGRVNVTYWASSKCVTDPMYLRHLDFFMDQNKYDLITFNNGLHSLHTDRAEWEAAYCNVVDYLHAKAPNAKISITLCTPLQEEPYNSIAVSLNAYEKKLAAEYGYPLLDLYTPMDPLDRNVCWADLYHFKAEAVAIQARVIADHVLDRLETASDSVSHASTATGPSGRID